MARKAKRGGGLGDTLLFAVVLLGIVLMALMTAGFYVYPVVCIALTIPSLFLGSKPRPLPDPKAFVDAERRAADRELLRALSAMEGERIRLHDLAGELGLDSTSASDGARYDKRKRDARTINQRLDTVEERLAVGIVALRDLREQIVAAVPDWRAPYRRWMAWRTWAMAAQVSLLVALLTAVAMMVARSDYPQQVALLSRIGDAVSSHLFWQPMRTDLLSISMTSVVAGYVTLFVARILFRWRMERLSASASMVRLLAFEHEFDPARIDVRPLFVDQPASEDPPTESWWAVLGISADATVDEIRAAYRGAIQGYHTDKVAHLGEKLRQVAEVECRRLNGAYNAAKTERGFA